MTITTTADIIVDTQGRPILVVPNKLSEGQTVLTIHEKSFEVSVDGKTEVKMEKIEDEFLIALGLQKKIGISVQEAGSPTPDTIHYVANVEHAF